MVCLLCPWLVWLVCLWACNVLMSACTCLCGFLHRDRPAERTCSLYVNMRPVCCMCSFILHVKISPDFPPVAIVSVSGKLGGSVSMCSVVTSATLTNSQEGCWLMKQSFTYCWLMGVKSSNFWDPQESLEDRMMPSTSVKYRISQFYDVAYSCRGYNYLFSLIPVNQSPNHAHCKEFYIHIQLSLYFMLSQMNFPLKLTIQHL